MKAEASLDRNGRPRKERPGWGADRARWWSGTPPGPPAGAEPGRAAPPRRRPRRVAGPGELDRDLGPGVARPHDQRRTLAQLGRPAVLARVQLDDGGVEAGRHGGGPPGLAGAGRDDDVRRLQRRSAEADDVAVAAPGQAVDAAPEAHRQPEAAGIGLQVVGHVVLARERASPRREGKAGEAVVAGRGEEPERVPPGPPGVADPGPGLEDHV